MTDEPVRATILRILGDVAPDADLSQLRGDAQMRDALDIDSMDFLNVVVAVAEVLHVEIPERDYGHLATLDTMVEYVRARLATQARR
jgi:acyl carrier protein